MSAIQSRLHTAIKKELAILVNVIKDFGPPEYPYELDGEENNIEKDFDQRVDVIPVSNPNAATMGQRIMQYQSALQLSAQAPQLYDLPTLHRQMLEVLGITDVDQIVPAQDNFKPKDPVSENMDILNSKPVKAFEYQDHDAHIKTHMSMMEDPEMQQMMQTSTMAQSIQGAFEAHITEKELGIELPEIGMELPEEVESRLSTLISEAAEQLLGKQKEEQQQEQNEAAAQDPVVQMQQEELALEKQKVESKIQTDQTKAQIDQAKLLLDGEKEQMRIDLEKLKIDSNERIEGAKIGAKIAERQADLSVKEQKISADQETKGAQIGSKIADQLLKGQ